MYGLGGISALFGSAGLLLVVYLVVLIVFLVLLFKLMTRGIKALDIYIQKNRF